MTKHKYEDVYKMTSNIEQEYYDFLCKTWNQFSEETKDALKPHQQLEHIYDALAQALNQFFQNKLKTLESEKNGTD